MPLGALLSLDRRRRRLLANVPPGPLRDFLAVPFPSPKADCRQVSFLALDLETTGLDAREDEILSMGWVSMQNLRIELSTAQHRLVHPSGPIPEQSAVIHKITDDTAAAGRPLTRVLSDLLAALAGKVLVAHHARIELGFLDTACRLAFGEALLVPTVDTLQLARRQLEHRDQAYQAHALRLQALRERYNLPRYRAHDALSDALAVAELFTAQLAEHDSSGALPLRRFLVRV